MYSGTLGGRPVAVKKVHQLLLDYASESEEALEAVLEGFRRECELLEAAKHANVVEFLGVFHQDGSALLVMELMGQTLEKFLKEERGTSLKRNSCTSACKSYQDCCSSTSTTPKSSTAT